MADEEKKKSFVVVIAPAKFKVLDSGIYRARLSDFRTSDDRNKWGHKVLTLRFDITEKGAYEKCYVENKINLEEGGTVPQGSKFWRLIKILSGAEPDIFDKVEIGNFIGKECFIHVQKKKNGNNVTEYIAVGDFADIR